MTQVTTSNTRGFTSGFGMTGGLIAGRDAMRLVNESKN